jgi:hypothetical protein
MGISLTFRSHLPGGSRTRDLLIANPAPEQTQPDQEKPTEQSGEASG